MNTAFLQFLMTFFFLAVISLHLVRKNFSAAFIYGVQSLIVVAVLVGYFWETGAANLLLVALLTLAVKVVLAPMFMVRLVEKHELKFSASSYLNTPLTLIVIAALTALFNSDQFSPITNIVPDHKKLLVLAMSSMFISLFVIINRKGALSQIVGILSLENSIVMFGIFANLEQSFGLQVGIVFDIFIFLVIAIVFMSMIYKHFGTLDISEMKNLKD